MIFLVFAVGLAAPPTIEPMAQVFELQRVRGLTVDERGSEVAYVLERWEGSASRPVRDIWLLQTRTGQARRLTWAQPDVASVRFGPEGDTLYFMANDADDHGQIWRVSTTLGQPVQITHAPHGVDAYDLDGGAQSLFYSTHSTEALDDAWSAMRDAYPGAQSAESTRVVSTIHRLDLNTWREEVAWTPKQWVMEFDVSPDQQRIAAIVAPDKALITHEGWSDVRIFDIASDKVITVADALWRDLAPSPHGWLLGLAWASDSSTLAFRVDFDGYPGEIFVVDHVSELEPVVAKLPRPHEVHPKGTDLAWVPGKRELCFRAADKAYVRVVCAYRFRDGVPERFRWLPSADVVVDAYAFSGDGRDIVAAVATEDRFTEIYRLPARGNLFPVQLSTLNSHTEAWPIPTIQTVTWKASDGKQVQGVLELPPQWHAGMPPLPMVTLLHGGPTSHVTASRRLSPYGRGWLAASGFAVFMPNYRGSLGYGDAFMTDLIGHEHQIETADILSGVDAMVAAGVADPARLAVMGWSNGGFLTASVITHTPRFKAAIVGAGVVDQTMQWALEDTPGHVINFAQGLPWEKPDVYQAMSPLFTADKISTPTLIHAGEADERVPVEHALALYRALHTYLKVPSELRIYKGMEHGLRTRDQLKAKMAWDLAWLNHWVLGEPPTVDAPQQGENSSPVSP